ncbi:right-handed parallel beta-helix repeat-containing protein [Spirosoma sp. KUDC1026]|uniref:right-handed parallel beta-helix repeat-containing protein n=1 Tax=Spirosoma sp. KUDC1026 TaxID=2745947 RepID=UPI00159B8C1F|nr:right-handed parallel beta-helix repeat-containing protein [Spirosoma sp. KUDC1026]QKZ12928.1 right-handed parallel beta-helix repeat-containing protein [Spirosoma sp. KUDC1026]
MLFSRLGLRGFVLLAASLLLIPFAVPAADTPTITVNGFTSAAVQAAINRAPASGARIVFPAGRYVFSNTCTLANKRNLILSGAGKAEFYVPAGKAICHMLNAVGPVSRIHLTGILFTNLSSAKGQGMIFSNEHAPVDRYEIDHCTFTAPRLNGNAIKLNAQSYGTGKNVSVPIKNVFIHHNTFKSLGRMGIEIQNHGWERSEAVTWQIDGVRIEDNAFSDLGRIDKKNGMAISISGPNQAIVIRRNRVTDATYAAYELVGSQNAEVSDNVAKAVKNTFSGISVSDNGHKITTLLRFTRNKITVKGSPFQLYAGNGGTITNWVATNNTFVSSTPSSADDGTIRVQGASGGRFADNVVRTGAYNALLFDNAFHNLVTKNQLSNAGNPKNYEVVSFQNGNTYGNVLQANVYQKASGLVSSDYAKQHNGAHDNRF